MLKILTENNFRYFIKSDEQRVSPLINKKSTVNPSMDLQLNIFAYRNSSSFKFEVNHKKNI